MQIFKETPKIGFLKHRYLAFGLSLALILIGVISLALRGGPRYGIDFAGGTVIQIKFTPDSKVNTDKIRQAVDKMKLGSFVIQQYGQAKDNEYMVRVQQAGGDLGNLNRSLDDNLTAAFGKGNFEVRRIEAIGPQVGKDLRQKGILAVFWALAGILIYVAVRFRQCEDAIALGAAGVLALFHDVFITIGVFSILDKELSLTVLAALLTLAGFSINDTIVTYDRFRENYGKRKREIAHDIEAYGKIWDDSINETLSRTLLTSFTVLMALTVLLIMGGEVIHDFSFALFFGVMVGVYSSVFVAAPMVYEWHMFWARRKKAAQIVSPISRVSSRLAAASDSAAKKNAAPLAEAVNSSKPATSSARKSKKRK